jgi:rubrerythrin
VEGVATPYNHGVDFFYDESGELSHKKKDIYLRKEDYEDPKIAAMLFNAFSGECMAHVRYKLYAEDAERRGLKNTAKLFRAASDSEWYHAKNFYYTMQDLKEPVPGVEESMENERHEVDELYKESLDYAKEQKLGLSAYAFTDALMAEKVHLKLFQKAYDELRRTFPGKPELPELPEDSDDKPSATQQDIAAETYFTCSSCGYTFAGAEHPANCPACGAPADKIIPAIC